MTTRRQTLLTRARIATAGLVLAAGSATGLLTVAAAQATNSAPATWTVDDDSGPTYGSDSSGTWFSISPGLGSPGGSSSSPGGAVAGSHSS
jgi:hypothetical protein